MDRFLVYNFSGELDEVSNLFPNERLATIAAVIRGEGKTAVVADRANFKDLVAVGSGFMEQLGRLGIDEHDRCYDAAVQTEAEGIARQGFDAALLNLWQGSGFKFTLDLLRVLKQISPGTKLFAVGQKVDWFGRENLRLAENRLDGLITGLGYNAVRALARGKSPAETPNLIYPSPCGILENARETIRVDDYPAADYAPEAYPEIASKVPVFPLTLSNQACSNCCAFCIRPENYGRANKRRDVRRVLAEIAALHEGRGVTHFRIEDSTPPQLALTRLAAEIVRSPLQGKITLGAFARIDENGKEDFRLLREAGFLALFFGIESLDDDTLVRLRKGISYDAIRKTLTAAHAAGLKTVGSFIYPSPGETQASTCKTLDRIRELKGVLDSVLVVPAAVHPPTAWGRDPEQFGIRVADTYLREAAVYPIRYLVPLKLWKPFPWTFDLMGRPAAEVTFADIVAVQSEFLGEVREGMGLPGIPDYYYLLAHRAGADPAEFLRQIVSGMIARNYAGLEALLMPAGPDNGVAPAVQRN